MQSLSIFIGDSQTAKRRLLQVFDLLDDSASQLERNGVLQGWEDGGSFTQIVETLSDSEVVGINRASLQ